MTVCNYKLFRRDAIVRMTIIEQWLKSQQPILFYSNPPLLPSLPPAIKHNRKPHYQRNYLMSPQGGRHGLH